MFGAPTYQAVVLLVVTLCIIFTYLLGYTFWTRTKKRYWSRYNRKFRDMFAPLIFNYIETASRRSDADKVVKKVTRRHQDFELFIELVDELSEIIQGDDQRKLNWLVKHPLFDRHYFKRLSSSSQNDQLLACVYYGKSGTIKQKVALKLLKLCAIDNIKVAFGAAKALQNSVDNEMRQSSLKAFFKRTDATSLMVGELLHLFHLNSDRMYQGGRQSLKLLLLEKDIPKNRKKVVIDYIANHNLYEYSTFLNHYIQKLLYRPENRSFIKHLISALGILKVEESAPLIRKYADNPDPDLRICCVEALNQLGGEENLIFITHMLLDIEFDVRRRIIETLVHDAYNGHLLLEKLMLTYLKSLTKSWPPGIPSKDLLMFVNKLQSITNGIRITSANKLRHQKMRRI